MPEKSVDLILGKISTTKKRTFFSSEIFGLKKSLLGNFGLFVVLSFQYFPSFRFFRSFWSFECFGLFRFISVFSVFTNFDLAFSAFGPILPPPVSKCQHWARPPPQCWRHFWQLPKKKTKRLQRLERTTIVEIRVFLLKWHRDFLRNEDFCWQRGETSIFMLTIATRGWWKVKNW